MMNTSDLTKNKFYKDAFKRYFNDRASGKPKRIYGTMNDESGYFYVPYIPIIKQPDFKDKN